MPIADCQVIIRKLEASLQPMTAEAAAVYVKLIVGAYPDQKSGDPQTYVRMLGTAMVRCPESLAMEVVDEVTRRHPKFRPSKGELEAVIEEACRKRRQAIRTAYRHVDEHRRREREKPKGRLLTDMPAEEREAFFADLRAKYPEGFAMVKRAAAERPKIEPSRRGLPTPPSQMFREPPPADPGLEEDVA